MSLQSQLSNLWKEIGPKSVEKFFLRARREGIPASRAVVAEFVRTITDRKSEIFQPFRQTGKSFARGPHSEWKVDLIQYAKPSSEGNFYVLVRVNSFSREADAIPLPTKSPQDTAQGLTEMLRRGTKPEMVFTDMGTEWGGEFAQLLEREGIDHGDKHPEDHGSFARIDAAIRTLKKEIAERRDDDTDWEAALPAALREYNADVNQTTGTAPKDVEKNKEATFFMLKQESQNLLHNLKDSARRQARIEEAGAVRHKLAKSEQDRQGPKKRIDDPTWGEQRRVVEGPGAFAFGQVATTDGELIPAKLTLPTRMAAPSEAPFEFEAPFRQLWEFMLEVGPLSLSDALTWLREQGALPENYKGRAETLFRQPFFSVDRGVLLANIRDGFEGVPVRLEQTRPAQIRPWKVRGAYKAPFQWGDLAPLARVDAEVRRALGKPEPKPLDLIRRVGKWRRFSDDELQEIYMKIAEGTLRADPLLELRQAPTGPRCLRSYAQIARERRISPDQLTFAQMGLGARRT